MKPFRSSRWYMKGVLALFFCCTVAASAQAVDFLPVTDVHTGMEGHVDTVVTGDDISSFNMKVFRRHERPWSVGRFNFS